MHIPIRFAALISTVYVLSCYALHEAGGTNVQNTAVGTPGFQAFFPGHYSQRQLSGGVDVAKSMAAGFGVANDASRFGSQFAYAKAFPLNTGSMNFQKVMDRPGLMLPMSAASVFPVADGSFSHGQVSTYNGGFQNGNWNADLWPAGKMHLFNAPSRNANANSDFPGKINSSPDGTSTNVDMTDPVLGTQIIKPRNLPLDKSQSEIDSNADKAVGNQSQIARKDYSDLLNKTPGPEFPPRKLRGRKRNNLRRFGVTRKNDRSTADVSRDSSSKFENKVDGASDENVSSDGITSFFTATEITRQSATEVIGDTSTEIDEDAATEVAEDAATEVAENAATEVAEDAATEVAEDAATEVAEDAATEVAEDAATEVDVDAATDVVGDAATEVAGDAAIENVSDIGTISTSSSGKSDVVVMTTEEVAGVALSSFMEATTDRLCLPAAVEDMKMVLSGLVPNGSVAMTTLPKVVTDLVSNIQNAYPELSPSEVATQAFTELCTALLHVLSHSPSAGSNVNYNTIPETAQIVSLMIQSGFDM